jgi:predicted TIM-barrel fold metal-dependent hydrolase
MKAHGRGKVLFGTNYPMLLPDKCLQDIDMLGLDEEGRGLFLHKNAEMVFGL